MPSPFDPLRSPDRWRHIKHDFYQGAHWRHAVERLLAVSIVALNDALLDMDVRHSPRLVLNGRSGSSTRNLTVHHRNIVRKRKTIKIGTTDIQIWPLEEQRLDRHHCDFRTGRHHDKSSCRKDMQLRFGLARVGLRPIL